MGGEGLYTPISNVESAGRRISYVANAGMGYTRNGSLWSVIYSKTLGDGYGLGSISTDSYKGTWTWTRPGSAWSLQASFGAQFLSGGGVQGFSGLQGRAGIWRMVERSVAVGAEYVYMRDSFATPSLTYRPAISAVRLTLAWINTRPKSRGAASALTNLFGAALVM
jgi:hypothetical protein